MDNQIPQNVAAEWAIISAILDQPSCITQVIGKLEVSDFYSSRVQNLFRTMLKMVEEREDITIVGVLGRHKGSEAVQADILYAIDQVAMPNSISTFVDLIKTESAKRQLQSLGKRITAMATEETDVQKTITMANDNLIRISKMKTCEWESNHDLVYRHFDTISRRNDNKDSLGVKSGFMDLDRITGGWRPGQLIFIGAVPKAGKTSAALHCAMKAEVPVLFFSLEMMPEELADRQFAVEAEVDAHSIITGHINDNDWAKVMGKMDTLMGKDISWIKKSGLSVLEIKAVAQRFKQENGLGLIIIDQLDKVSERKQGNENRTDQIGRVTRGLKEMALELEVPVLCLVQLLDKNIGQRKNKRPSSGDVRDSSYPDQDCDVMIYLWRPAIYYPDAKSWANTAELIVSRQRSGATGSAWVQWTPEFTKFRELDVNTQNYMRNVNWAKDADE